jgi:hypothetical protein
MFTALKVSGFVSELIANSNLITNQTKIIAFSYDCIRSGYFSSVAYSDVFIAIFYSIMILVVGLLYTIVKTIRKEFAPNYKYFVLLYSFWSQISQLTFYVGAALACERILNKYYVKGDVT